MRSRPASRGKVSFPSYAPPSGKVWYSTSEGITIAVSAKQREIALRNLDEQGMKRPLQYDDPSVTADMLCGSAKNSDDPMRESEMMSGDGRPHIFMALLRFVFGVALNASTCFLMIDMPDGGMLDHLHHRHGFFALVMLVTYSVISFFRLTQDRDMMRWMISLICTAMFGAMLVHSKNFFFVGIGTFVNAFVIILDVAHAVMYSGAGAINPDELARMTSKTNDAMSAV